MCLFIDVVLIIMTKQYVYLVLREHNHNLLLSLLLYSPFVVLDVVCKMCKLFDRKKIRFSLKCAMVDDVQ